MLQVSGIYICYLLQLRRYFLWLKSGPESLRFHRRKAYFLVKRKTILSYCPSERYYLTFPFTQAQFCFGEIDIGSINDLNPWIDIFLCSHYLFSWYCKEKFCLGHLWELKGQTYIMPVIYCFSLRPTSPYGKRYGVVTSKNVDGKS